jgi:peptidase M23-like protein
MATARTISTRGALAALLVPFVLFAAAGLVIDSAQASSPGSGCVGTYGWPVKPFDRAHPIRGGFGDPRTVFKGQPSGETLLQGDGSFSFHQGLDISAPDRSPVYAVSSGTVVRARGGRVTVDCGNGRTFQYWHVDPVARVGQHTVAGKTLLGFVQLKREHVHLTHLEDGRAVNPLTPNRLTPYRDRTVPHVLGITVQRNGRFLTFTAEAVDMPSLPVPGRWHGFPITPALVTWRIEDSSGRRVVAGCARDVRRTVPPNNRFWNTFARGTHQNWPVFDGHKQRGMAGRYLFKLTGTAFDTRTLSAGAYVLVVSAQDTAGNRGLRRVRFDVANA